MIEIDASRIHVERLEITTHITEKVKSRLLSKVSTHTLAWSIHLSQSPGPYCLSVRGRNEKKVWLEWLIWVSHQISLIPLPGSRISPLFIIPITQEDGSTNLDRDKCSSVDQLLLISLQRDNDTEYQLGRGKISIIPSFIPSQLLSPDASSNFNSTLYLLLQCNGLLQTSVHSKRSDTPNPLYYRAITSPTFEITVRDRNLWMRSSRHHSSVVSQFPSRFHWKVLLSWKG